MEMGRNGVGCIREHIRMYINRYLGIVRIPVYNTKSNFKDDEYLLNVDRLAEVSVIYDWLGEQFTYKSEFKGTSIPQAV